MRKLFYVLFATILCSCNQMKPVDVEAYYDVDSLINAQYESLKFSGNQIFKTSVVNGKSDTSYIRPDTSQWNYELGVFRKANINKPTLRGEYEVKREKVGGSQVVTYIPKEPEKRTVRELQLKYSGSTLQELNAVVMENNPVYESSRTLTMNFNGADGSNRLISYEVTGSQKMMLKDTVTLHVKSEILYE